MHKILFIFVDLLTENTGQMCIDVYAFRHVLCPVYEFHTNRYHVPLLGKQFFPQPFMLCVCVFIYTQINTYFYMRMKCGLLVLWRTSRYIVNYTDHPEGLVRLRMYCDGKHLEC
jgi:hypothetical protein